MLWYEILGVGGSIASIIALFAVAGSVIWIIHKVSKKHKSVNATKVKIKGNAIGNNIGTQINTFTGDNKKNDDA